MFKNFIYLTFVNVCSQIIVLTVGILFYFIVDYIHMISLKKSFLLEHVSKNKKLDISSVN